MAKSSKKAKCHPDKFHTGKGLCATCYARLYRTNETAKTKIRQNSTKYRKSEKGKLNSKKYRKEYETRDSVKLRRKQYRSSPRGKLAANRRQARYRQSEASKQYRRAYERSKERTDIQFKLGKRLRVRLYNAIRKNLKTGSAVRDLGCTLDQLKTHLESLFQPGMTWDNWGKYGWHIDHIIPLSAFNLMDREQLLKACHYTNLQPLWAFDNLSKKDKY
jgi:hypothetical protein